MAFSDTLLGQEDDGSGGRKSQTPGPAACVSMAKLGACDRPRRPGRHPDHQRRQHMKHQQPAIRRSGLALVLLLAWGLLALAGCGGETYGNPDPAYGEPTYGPPSYGGRPSCPPGHRWDGYRCVHVRPDCPPHHHWDGNRCVDNRRDCPRGQRWDNGRCVDVRPDCPPHHHWDGNRCVDNRRDCPRGQRWENGRCVDVRPDCPSGQHWDHNQRRCLPNSR
jgi:hypothetical protein